MSSPLNIWDEKEQKYVPLPCLKGDKGDPAATDQTYAPTSENAQSGKAVAEAVAIEQKRSDNTFANALKSSKSGSAILIDDISPVTHEMSVKISSDTVTDLTAVKVTRCGKNLLYNDTIISESTNPVYKKIWSGNLPAPFVFSEDLSQFTPTEGLASAATFRFKLADGTEKVIGKDYKYLLVRTGILKEIYFVNNSQGIGTIKCQLEIGTVKTDYEPYVEPTEYTPNADGTVNGVTSLYPNTTLMTDTDGVIITCEYNKDINKFSGVDVYVPTKTSELINDSNFATQDYVDEEIANFDFIKIVTELPETGLVNRTYFVPKQNPATNDLYDEYMWVDDKWELITTKQIEVDLTGYVKNTDINQSYDPTSENAQSGKAVKEAVEPKLDKPEIAPEVGKVLEVKSVNEDGTFICEWASGSNDWVLIAKGEITEEVFNFIIDKDMNGNDFELSEFHLRTKLLSSNGKDSDAFLRINKRSCTGVIKCLMSSSFYANENTTHVISFDGKEMSISEPSFTAGGIGTKKCWTNPFINKSFNDVTQPITVNSVQISRINSSNPHIAEGAYELWGRYAK